MFIFSVQEKGHIISMDSASQILISFSPEQFIYFIVAIVGASLAVVFWVHRQTHALGIKLAEAKTDIANMKESIKDQKADSKDLTKQYSDISIKLNMYIAAAEERDRQKGVKKK